MKKRYALLALAIVWAASVFGAEPVKLFLEDDGSPGKVNALTMADQNLHPTEDFFYNENYFLIAITEGGHYGYVNILISNTGVKKHTPAVSFTVVTPERKRIVRDVDFAPEDLVMKKDKFDLTLKDNYFRQTADGYELKLEADGLGMELKYKNRVPGMVLGNGKAAFGSEGDYLYINYPAPRPEVTGKFTVEGKEVPVSGWGYIDHSLTVTNPANFQKVWHNMKFRSDTHTLLISSFTTPDKFDKDFSFGLVANDDEVICTFTDVKVEEEEVKTDQTSGKPYPGKVTYALSGDGCSARAMVDTSNPTEKFDVLAKLDQKWWGKAAKVAINTFIAEPWYFRVVEPVEVELTANGETIKVKGTAFNEIIFTE